MTTGDDGVQRVTMGGNGWQRVTTGYKYNIYFFTSLYPAKPGIPASQITYFRVNASLWLIVMGFGYRLLDIIGSENTLFIVT